MRVFLLLLFLSSSSCLAFCQQEQNIETIEDYYESGKLYSRHFIRRLDSVNYEMAGLRTYWYENGQKLSEELLSHTDLTKHINCWTADGTQICINGNGMFYETWTDFEADSTVYSIKDSIKQGPYTSYIPDEKGYRKIAEGNYINGLRQGEVKYFYETGELLCIKTYSNNRDSGIYKGYYKNGQLKETGFQVYYEKEGEWQFLNDRGILMKKETFKKNKLKQLVEYYPNGQVKTQGSFVQLYIKPTKQELVKQETAGRRRRATNIHTVKEGIWIVYSPTGKVLKKEIYFNGKLKKSSL